MSMYYIDPQSDFLTSEKNFQTKTFKIWLGFLLLSQLFLRKTSLYFKDGIKDCLSGCDEKLSCENWIMEHVSFLDNLIS